MNLIKVTKKNGKTESCILLWCKIINKFNNAMTMPMYIPILNFQEYIDGMIAEYGIKKFETDVILLEKLKETITEEL